MYRFYSGAWSERLDLGALTPFATGIINVGSDEETAAAIATTAQGIVGSYLPGGRLAR